MHARYLDTIAQQFMEARSCIVCVNVYGEQEKEQDSDSEDGADIAAQDGGTIAGASTAVVIRTTAAATRMRACEQPTLVFEWIARHTINWLFELRQEGWCALMHYTFIFLPARIAAS